MIPYILFQEPDKNGNMQQFILQKAFPNYIGKISDRPVETILCQQPISGYNLWLQYTGTLKGNQIPFEKGALKEMEEQYFTMAAYFYTVMDTRKYEKYKIKTDATNRA